jgi:hypothetical protein
MCAPRVTRHTSIRYSSFSHTHTRQHGSTCSLHTLASPGGRNVNYDEKQLTGGKKFELFLLSVLKLN